MEFLSTVLVAALAIVVGIGLTFWGYRFFLVFLPVIGFFAGFWFGAEATSLIFGEGFLATTTSWVVGFLLGLVVAIFSYVFYLFGVALIAGLIGFGLASGLMSAFGLQDGIIVLLISIAAGVLVAFLTLRADLQKYVVMALTAIAGADAIILGVLLLLGRVSLESLQQAGTAIAPVLQDSWFWLLAWIALAAAGIYVQWRNSRRFAFTKEDYAQTWG